MRVVVACGIFALVCHGGLVVGYLLCSCYGCFVMDDDGAANDSSGGTEIETTETGKRRGSGRAAHGVGVKKRCLMLDVPVSIVEVDQFLAE